MSAQSIVGLDPATGLCIEVRISGATIEAIESCDEPTDRWLSAGLVDLQVNGYMGLDCNALDVGPKTLPLLARALLALGVTTFAPTVITASEPDILSCLQRLSEGRASDAVTGACVPYFHVEGPHISPLEGYRGAHRQDCVRPPSLAEFQRWQDACGGLVGMVTMSPHWPDSEEYIAALVSSGVYVSIGHSHASHEQIQRAVDAGARLSTHLGNGIATMLERHPNPIWSQLAEDRLTSCFIADGHHLPVETLKAMVCAKGVSRSILVSDAVALAGMPPGHYTTPVGGKVELSPQGRLSVEGTTTLAGSALPLVDCIGRAARMTGRPLSEVLAMATEHPGRFTGGRGCLRVGARADIFRFQWTDRIVVEDVWLAGALMHTAGVD